MRIVQRPIHHSIVCEAAPNKKADSAAKRARQAEKRRICNKARKSEVKTRMKKVTFFFPPFTKILMFALLGFAYTYFVYRCVCIFFFSPNCCYLSHVCFGNFYFFPFSEILWK